MCGTVNVIASQKMKNRLPLMAETKIYICPQCSTFKDALLKAGPRRNAAARKCRKMD